MDETFSSSHGSWVFQKGSRLQADFGRVIGRLTDTGVVGKISEESKRDRRFRYLFDPKYEDLKQYGTGTRRTTNEALSLTQIYLPLIFLIVGWITSVSAFLAEKFIFDHDSGGSFVVNKHVD